MRQSIYIGGLCLLYAYRCMFFFKCDCYLSHLRHHNLTFIVIWRFFPTNLYKFHVKILLLENTLSLKFLNRLITRTNCWLSKSHQFDSMMSLWYFTMIFLHRLTKEMSHVDQYGFRYQFGANEGLLLHYLCQQLHEHYNALKSNNKRIVDRWTQLLHVNATSMQMPLSQKVS